MRDIVLELIQANTVTGFTLSTELPWDKDGASLYLKNMKTLYVDQAQTTQEALIDTLDGAGVSIEETTVTVYVVVDAKQLPTRYNDLIIMLKSLRVSPSISGYNQRTTDVLTSYEGDRLVTEIVFNFQKLINNCQ